MKNGKAYNGEEHGKLYSPEFAAGVHISTTEQQEKGKDEEPSGKGQGELYSPETAIPLPKNHQLKKGKEVRMGEEKAETKEKQSAAAADECMGGMPPNPKPSSKL